MWLVVLCSARSTDIVLVLDLLCTLLGAVLLPRSVLLLSKCAANSVLPDRDIWSTFVFRISVCLEPIVTA